MACGELAAVERAHLPAHRLIGFDRDESIVRGFARLGVPLSRSDFALRAAENLTEAQYAELLKALRERNEALWGSYSPA